MAKLKLSLDALEVESFVTVRMAGAGTVRAHVDDNSALLGSCATCEPVVCKAALQGTLYDCGGGTAGGNSCPVTCQYSCGGPNTCQQTCAPSCGQVTDCTCQQTMCGGTCITLYCTGCCY